MTSTQQNEAMQAVRLLFVAACGGSSVHKNPETLYRARRVLEEFIESAVVVTTSKIRRKWNPREIKDTDREPNIAGFYLGDKVTCSDEVTGYVMWLDQNRGLIGCYLDLVGESNVIEAHPTNLELIAHGTITISW